MLKTNEFRKKMADAFIKSLEEKQFEWKKEWAAMETPYNVISGKKYSCLLYTSPSPRD